jgi:hypothetical protein
MAQTQVTRGPPRRRSSFRRSRRLRALRRPCRETEAVVSLSNARMALLAHWGTAHLRGIRAALRGGETRGVPPTAAPLHVP